jgi:hypothetical protein
MREQLATIVVLPSQAHEQTQRVRPVREFGAALSTVRKPNRCPVKSIFFMARLEKRTGDAL